MVTQYGIKYAVNLITAHFGDLVAKVCECLLRKGPLTLQAIVRSTELTSSQVKNSLLVLIQHNCVQAFILDQTGEHGDGAKQSTQYIALFDNIIQRWRFPKFLTMVSKKLDKQCVELLEGLLQHGRLTLKQMFDRAKSGDDVVQEAFVKLLNAHFIERCPASEPVLTNPTKEEEAARKRAAKSGKLLLSLVQCWKQLEVQRRKLKQRIQLKDKNKRVGVMALAHATLLIIASIIDKTAFYSSTVTQFHLRRDFKKIIELAQHEEVESIVLKRYGRDAYRMFRLLSNSGHLLETDKVADATFVEKKETPIILYKLWKDDYLQLEKLQIGVKQTPFQLWKVNKSTLKVHVLDEMFHAAFNLSQRVAFELEQEKELSNVLQDKRVNRLRKRLLLESSQMKLDDAIMLFHDF
ncbi:hypothetical protein GOBAR_DD13635 [Gossypium barbadense]|nr:hypothetical protein GOBAR_DD13635 [Gossypium barbadense]